ncbi:MAG: type IV pilus assembly protein PilM [Verrucomicrobiae bacterium]|nr:type IV pilus assembly protein PilM [Verrucomicrobiae bacterium]
MASMHFLGIDLGDRTVKVGEFLATEKEGLTLVNFGRANLDIDSSSEETRVPAIVAAVRNLIKEKRFKTKRVALSVSGQVVLTRFMKIPAAEEAKVRQMVRYEAEQNVPFPMDEVVWDYQVVGGFGGAELDVAMVAIKKDIIERFNGAIEEVGLVLQLVDVAPLSIYNTVRFNYNIENSSGCTLVLDIGARTTNLIFVEDGKIFTRSIPIAGNTITQYVCQEFEIPFQEAEKLKFDQGFVGLGGAYEEPELESAAKLSKIIRNVMTRLHAEVSRSISFYKTQQAGRAPQRLLLSGGTSVLPYTDFFFQEKMEIDVEYLNPFQNVRIETPVEELEKVAHSMGEVVGLGLRMTTECPVEINLLPPTIIKRRQFNRRVPYFAAAMVGVILICLSWWMYYWRVTRMLDKHLATVTQQVEALEGLNGELKKALAGEKMVQLKMSQVTAVGKMRCFWLEFFEDLNSMTPANVWIAQLTPECNGQAIGGASVVVVGGSSAPRARRGGSIRSVDPMEMMPPDMAPGGGGKKTSDTGGPKMIDGFEILGLCLNDLDFGAPLDPVMEFRNNLERKSKFINHSKVEVLEQGNPKETEWTFSFRFKVKLKEPVPY